MEKTNVFTNSRLSVRAEEITYAGEYLYHSPKNFLKCSENKRDRIEKMAVADWKWSDKILPVSILAINSMPNSEVAFLLKKKTTARIGIQQVDTVAYQIHTIPSVSI